MIRFFKTIGIMGALSSLSYKVINRLGICKMRWKIVVAYHGAGYAGWQRQTDAPSVQGAIEAALYAFCQREITLYGAGRTDAGVHAVGQVAHFDLDYGDRALSGEVLVRALNAHLRPQNIAIVSACPVPDSFHARFAAVDKIYRYRILVRSAPPVLEQGLLWHLRGPLDVEAMREGAAHVVGHHDFSSFRDSHCQAKSPVRTLDVLDITSHPYDEEGGVEIVMTARARSFLHHQIRIIAGTLALIGQGKWKPCDVATALKGCNRSCAGPTAPAQGLCLMHVGYAPFV